MSLQHFLTRMIWWCVAPFLVLTAGLAIYQARQAQALFELQAKQVAHDFVQALERSPQQPAPGAGRQIDLTPAQLTVLQHVLDQLALPQHWRLKLLDVTQAVLAQRGFSGPPQPNDKPWRFATPHHSQPWSVALEIPANIYRAPVFTALSEVVLGILFATAVAVLGGTWARRSLTRSLNELINFADADAPDSRINEVDNIRHRLDDALRWRDRAQAKLAASERALREAQRLAKLGHWRWVPHTGEVAWSAEIFEIFGCNPHEPPLSYDTFQERLTSASRAQLTPLVDAMVAHGTAYACDLEIIRTDGTQRCISLRGEATLAADGQVADVYGTLQDITERKRTENELHQHRHALEQLVASRTAELTAALQDSQIARHSLTLEVAQHQQTESRLQLSQLTLNQAARLAQLGAWRVDLACPRACLDNPVTWSDEMYRLLDYTVDTAPQPTGDLYLARVHPDDQQGLRALTLQSLADRTPWQTAYRLQQTNGDVRWVVEVGEFIFDASGQALSMHGAVKDVTEQRRTEQQLRDSQASLHQALRDARAAYYEWHIESHHEIWSDEYWGLIGLEPNAVPPSREAWLASIHPDDRARITALDDSAVLQGACYEIEWRVNLPDDQPVRWLLDRCQPVTEPDGRVLRYRGIVVDISERKQAELSQDRYLERLEDRVAERTAALSHAQERQRRLNRALRLLSECNGAMVRATNEQQLLDDLCRYIVTTGGYRMGWLGVVVHDECKSLRMLAHSGGHADYFATAPVSWDNTQLTGRGPIGMAVSTGETQVNADYQGPDLAPWREAAQQRGFRASVALPIHIDNQVWGVLGLYAAEPHTFGAAEVRLLEELTSNMAFGLQSLRARAELDAYRLQLEDRVTARTREVVELNMALQGKARDAEAANRAKSTFLATMSHELRTPLNAVMGLAGLLAESLTERRQRDYADKIELSAKALRALIDDVLDYAKIEDGALTLERAPFSLNAILRVAAAVVSVGVANKPVEVVFDVTPDVPDALVGDGLRVQQILLNLCSNAVKFTQAGAIVVSVRCPTQSATQATLCFSVRDTGIGIAGTQLGPIFDAFTQVNQVTSRVYGGTGLGLSISARLAGLMGGRIEADSTLAQGSEFRVSLTLERTPALPAPVSPMTANVPPNLKVLVVDDDALARDVLLRTCAALGWQAHGVDNAEAGLQALLESTALANDYDLLLLDWRMPGTDGLAMLRQAKATRSIRLPMVVLMTSLFELEEAAAASDDLVLDGMTTKPVLRKSLSDAVARAFSSDFTGILPTLAGRDLRLQGMRLLVADDNDINLEMMTHILAHAGAEVTPVVNGLEAVRAVQDLHPPHTDFDAVLMDIQMPVINGYEATRQIRKRLGRVDLPIIAVTAFAQPEDREKSRSAGMVGHVVKPIDVDALFDILASHRPALTRAAATPLDANASPGAPTRAPPVVLDMPAALKAFGGEPGPYRAMLRKFINQHGNDASEAACLWHTQDPPARQDAAGLVHDLRGMAGILHAPALAQCAAATEDALRNPATAAADMAPLFKALVQAMAQVVAEVEGMESGSEGKAAR